MEFHESEGYVEDEEEDAKNPNQEDGEEMDSEDWAAQAREDAEDALNAEDAEEVKMQALRKKREERAKEWYNSKNKQSHGAPKEAGESEMPSVARTSNSLGEQITIKLAEFYVNMKPFLLELVMRDGKESTIQQSFKGAQTVFKRMYLDEKTMSPVYSEYMVGFIREVRADGITVELREDFRGEESEGEEGEMREGAADGTIELKLCEIVEIYAKHVS